jgi:hypothetical protein
MQIKIRLFTAVLLLISLRASLFAQYHWSPLLSIDTSSYPSPIGGEMAVDDSGGNIYVTFGSTDAGKFFIVHSTNYGSTWIQYENVGPELSRVPRDIVVDHKGNVWLLWVSWADEFSPAFLNLSKSSDSGRTFTTLLSSLSYSDGQLFQKLAIDDQNSVYMLWDDAQFKVTKFRSGDINQRIDADIQNDTLQIGNFPVLMVSRDFVVHCAWEGFFFDTNNEYHEYVFYSRSNDSGLTFQGSRRVDTTSSVHHLPALAVDNTGEVFVSYTRELNINQSDVRIVRSKDEGQSFFPPLIISGADTAYESAIGVDAEKGLNILWDSKQGTTHDRSTDGGISFTSSEYVGYMGLHNLKSDQKGMLYVTGEYNRRLYVTKTNIELSVSRNDRLPSPFALFQNYPNPFNPSTTIRISIGKSVFVNVRVYDIMGRELATLISERLSPGMYSIPWDATAVSSGIYFVRVTVGRDWIGTRKMVLLR